MQYIIPTLASRHCGTPFQFWGIIYSAKRNRLSDKFSALLLLKANAQFETSTVICEHAFCILYVYVNITISSGIMHIVTFTRTYNRK